MPPCFLHSPFSLNTVVSSSPGLASHLIQTLRHGLWDPTSLTSPLFPHSCPPAWRCCSLVLWRRSCSFFGLCALSSLPWAWKSSLTSLPWLTPSLPLGLIPNVCSERGYTCPLPWISTLCRILSPLYSPASLLPHLHFFLQQLSSPSILHWLILVFTLFFSTKKLQEDMEFI